MSYIFLTIQIVIVLKNYVVGTKPSMCISPSMLQCRLGRASLINLTQQCSNSKLAKQWYLKITIYNY